MADVCEVMLRAMEMEEDSQRFYLDAASVATNPLARRTFEALAEWEVEHKKLLQSVYDEAATTGGCPTLDHLSPEQVEIIEEAALIFKTALEDIEDTLAHDPTLEGAYATAMGKERMAIAFYRQQLDETHNENERQLYQFLLDQERGHLNLLATTEEYLNDTKYWHFKQEQWIVTG
ncbi:MAG: ferritin family protein [Armatimonadota bacterium]